MSRWTSRKKRGAPLVRNPGYLRSGLWNAKDLMSSPERLNKWANRVYGTSSDSSHVTVVTKSQLDSETPLSEVYAVIDGMNDTLTPTVPLPPKKKARRTSP